MLEETLRWGFVEVLTIEQVVVNALLLQLLRAAHVVKRQMRQTALVVGQRTFGFVVDLKTALKSAT